MPADVLGYAARSADTDLASFRFERRAPRVDDVVIDILFCGVCHTDLHFARDHKGVTHFPVVPGHEIVGRVAAVGTEVARFRPGDLVGVGCMVDSCGECAPCRHGQEQHCAEGATFTYNGTDRQDGSTTYGGYAEAIVVSDRFVFSLPDGLDPAAAAPLLCAGITTWEPLRQYGIGPDSKVAVIGLGGLGHMALKLARAMDADVTLFTRSPDKEADALRLGAHRAVLSTDDDAMKALTGRFDLIIDTVPYAHDVNSYLPTLGVGGALVLVGFMGPLDPPVAAGALVYGRRAIGGSFIGGVPATQAMLDFCAEHAITADVEVIPAQGINAAYARMLEGDVRYRFVIDAATFGAGEAA